MVSIFQHKNPTSSSIPNIVGDVPPSGPFCDEHDHSAEPGNDDEQSAFNVEDLNDADDIEMQDIEIDDYVLPCGDQQ